jgi:hypothetical protein
LDIWRELFLRNQGLENYLNKKKQTSPFAKPDIALAWPVGLGVNDKYAYIGDSLNRHLMRVKFI